MTRRLLPLLALATALASPVSRVTWGQTPSEPTFDPAQSRMLFSETFDNYNFERLHPPCGAAEPKNTVIDHSWYYCKQFSPGYDAGVVTVPGHSGLAVQFHYEGKSQETHGIQTSAKSVTPTGKATTVVQYWARFTPDGGNRFTDKSIVQIKNVLLWHENNRFQIMTHGHSGGCKTYGPSYTMLGVIDQADIGCDSDQPVGPFFKSFADGDWHRWTILYKPNTSQGSRDGRGLLWIDGQLVVRIEASAVGVTPPGGWKPWCTAEEVDALYSGSYGVGSVEWGANLTVDTAPFSMAVDDVRWWVQK